MATDTFDSADYIDYARTCSIPYDIAHAAAERMRTDPPVLLACSGKLVAGKDTIPPAVYQALDRPMGNVVHLYYAAAVKDDLDVMLEALRDDRDDDLGRFGIDRAKAEHLADLLLDELAADPAVTARTRTPGIRAALQFFGTDVRRAQDDDYWVKRALAPAVVAVSEGRDVYFSDIRFPNEVLGAQRLGFHVVRLEVTAETQRRRLLERDNLEPDPASITHPSETALDSFDGFDQVLDNNGALSHSVERIVAALDR
jgi:chloramphenicol 3-O-phosphotransferase